MISLKGFIRVRCNGHQCSKSKSMVIGWPRSEHGPHYSDVIMGTMASQITILTIVYATVYSGADQRKHQSSASLAFVWGIHRWPVNSPHKWPVTREMLQWISNNMGVVCTFSCLVVFSLWSMLPISFRVITLALRQSYDCPTAREAITKNIYWK